MWVRNNNNNNNNRDEEENGTVKVENWEGLEHFEEGYMHKLQERICILPVKLLFHDMSRADLFLSLYSHSVLTASSLAL